MSHQKPSESLYTITVSRQQLAILSSACELVARLGIGQWREALDYLPMKGDINYESYHAHVDFIGRLLSEHMVGNIDGYRSNLGMTNELVKEEPRIAYDMHQVMRHKLAWDNAKERGVINEDGSRNFPEMLGVRYDDPMKTSTENFCKINNLGEEGE